MTLQSVDPKLSRYDLQVANMLKVLRAKNMQIMVTKQGAYIIKPTRNLRGAVTGRKIVF